MSKPKWKFSKEWEEKIRAIVNDQLGKSEDWIRNIIQDEFQRIKGARGSR